MQKKSVVEAKLAVGEAVVRDWTYLHEGSTRETGHALGLVSTG